MIQDKFRNKKRYDAKRKAPGLHEQSAEVSTLFVDHLSCRVHLAAVLRIFMTNYCETRLWAIQPNAPRWRGGEGEGPSAPVKLQMIKTDARRKMGNTAPISSQRDGP